MIELKRPAVSIGKDQLDQIKGYAQAVANDSRFASVNTTWEFWIVGDEVDPKIRHKLAQGNLPADVVEDYHENGFHVTIHAVTWAQIIQNARHRLKFVRDQLRYDPTSEVSLDTLRKMHAEVLPSILLPDATSANDENEPTEDEELAS